jgi:chloramphenicol-sensitive protein RarD
MSAATGAGQGGSTLGVAYALSSFTIWGITPVYWKILIEVSAWEILAQRIVWSLAFVAVLLTVARGWSAVAAAMRGRRNLLTLIATAALMSGSWGIGVWAVQAGNLLEVSLAFFITPLVVVALGVAILREPLGAWKGLAILLAAAGVVVQVVSIGAMPWLGLGLAVMTGLYGFIRKVMPLAYIAFLLATGTSGTAGYGIGGWLLVAGTGLVTGLPLLLYTAAARLLRLSTIGILQYLAPTLQFLLAVIVFREPFTTAHLVTFACIWAGLAIYTWDSMRAQSRPAPAAIRSSVPFAGSAAMASGPSASTGIVP